ncbi:MAG: NAD(P)/FAD-dependent oxidoreductase [Dongiaceae bacterium]
MQSYDVVIVGGGVMGSSVAFFLKGWLSFPGSVLVVERDPTYADAATPRSAGGIRQQFSTPENIRMGQFGAAFIKKAGEHLAVDGDAPLIPFVENGYLFLASGAGMDILRGNHEIQKSLGADNVLLSGEEIRGRFPWMNTDELAGGCYGLSNEGWTDPYGLLQAFRRKARALGVTYLADTVTALKRDSNRVTAVATKDNGEIACGAVVNSSGYRAREVAATAGIDLPVRPRKRLVYVFDCREQLGRVPLTIEPNGVWFRPEGASYICGVSPEESADPDCTDFEIDYSFYEDLIWPTIAARVPAFEAIKLTRAWAGHYDYNTLDQNAILGPHPDIGNFYFCNGFSGHGLQQSPAVGRGTAELIVNGAYKSIDLTRFGYGRVLRNEPLREINVV